MTTADDATKYPVMKSVLIVESNLDFRRALLVVLGRHGWSVDALDSVESAVAFLSHQPACAVLLGSQLRDGLGLDVLIAVRMSAGWKAVPVIMMDANCALEHGEELIEKGANDFLPIPYFGGDVLEKLQRWVLEPGPLSDAELRLA